MLTPESRCLVMSASSVVPGGSARVADDVDWRKLARLAHQERATAVLGRWLHARGLRPPADLAAQWRAVGMVAEFQAGRLERLLHDSLRLLAGHGIEAVLLKGAGLVYSVYGSFADRPMGDLDLLVRPDRAEQAWQLLQGGLWTWPARELPRERYGRHQHLPPLQSNEGDDACLEIHVDLFPGGHPFQWPIESVWAAAREIDAGAERPVLVPDPLHQLLHVCLHFAWSHEMQWGAWRTLRDVQAITRRARGGIAWDRFVECATASRAATCCYWTLRLARALAGAVVPDAALRALQPPRPEFILGRLENHYVRQLFPLEDGCPSKALSKRLWELGIAPAWSGHGAARPWHVSERWLAEATPRGGTAAWPARMLRRARHAAVAMGYLGRLTARPASAAPTTPSVP